MTTEPLITYEASLTLKHAVGDEIVDGRLRQAPRPAPHQPHLIETLRSQFFWQLDRRRYDIRTASFALLIRRDPLTYREPDLAISLKQNIRQQDSVYMTSPPDLLVEAYAAGHQREAIDTLLTEYASIGVPEVWALDMDRPALHRFQLEAGVLIPSGEFLKGPLRPAKLSATIRVETLWDALAPEREREYKR